MGDARNRVDELDTLDSEPPIRTCPQCGALTDAHLCPNDGTATHVVVVRPRSDPYVGRVVADRYRIESLLGEGGMGRVYSAVQLSLGQRVAIKVLLPEREESDLSVRRFHREARAATRLHSPHVVRVFDFGVDPLTSAPFLVMELLRGQTVHALLRSQGALSAKRALTIVQQVLRALVEADEQQLVHRDIKPENLFIVDTGDQSDFVKVMDFGVARSAADPREGNSALTLGGRIVGTPAYMSPEQIQGGDVTSRSDLYSVGCTLHELLTACRPYADSKDAVTAMVAHLSSPPPQLAELASTGESFSPSVRCIHDALLQKRPDDRPPNSRAALYAVQAALDGRPVDEIRSLLAGGASVVAPAALVAAREPPAPPTAEGTGDAALGRNRPPWTALALVAVVVTVALVAWSPWADHTGSGGTPGPVPAGDPNVPAANPAAAPAAPSPAAPTVAGPAVTGPAVAGPAVAGPAVADLAATAFEPRRDLDEGSRGADRLGPELVAALPTDPPVTPRVEVTAPNRPNGRNGASTGARPRPGVRPAPPVASPPTAPKPLPW